MIDCRRCKMYRRGALYIRHGCLLPTPMYRSQPAKMYAMLYAAKDKRKYIYIFKDIKIEQDRFSSRRRRAAYNRTRLQRSTMTRSDRLARRPTDWPANEEKMQRKKMYFHSMYNACTMYAYECTIRSSVQCSCTDSWPVRRCKCDGKICTPTTVPTEPGKITHVRRSPTARCHRSTDQNRRPPPAGRQHTCTDACTLY